LAEPAEAGQLHLAEIFFQVAVVVQLATPPLVVQARR
jgi:hypothetical protein